MTGQPGPALSVHSPIYPTQSAQPAALGHSGLVPGNGILDLSSHNMQYASLAEENLLKGTGVADICHWDHLGKKKNYDTNQLPSFTCPPIYHPEGNWLAKF